MAASILDDISHRRFNPLRGSWVLVSPHRTKRPWLGQQEEASETTLPTYDSNCYLCPGNQRAQGDVNPQYDNVFAFVNDYSAVKQDQPDFSTRGETDDAESVLLRATGVTGRCYVLTFSSAHNQTLADLGLAQISTIVTAWTQMYALHTSPDSPLAASAKLYLSSTPPSVDLPVTSAQFDYMQIFENKGAAMGCSNPHPHGQIWCTTGIPEEPAAEMEQLAKYRAERNGANMLVDYASLESKKQERVVFENQSFVVVCPWWATWPFEVLIVSRQHRRALTELSPGEQRDLAAAISDVVRRYDNLFETHFPYSMGVHQAPLAGSLEMINASHLHIHCYPPLLRSATVKKFLVGYELMAEPQRDITPEQAAARLRACGGPLYRVAP